MTGTGERGAAQAPQTEILTGKGGRAVKELSLNILDIAQNSLRAGAAHVEIALSDRADGLRALTVTDDGSGMDAALLSRVTDPFSTTRTTRPVGLGLPLLKLAAEQTGGTLTVESRTAADARPGEAFAAGSAHGTRVTATFDPRHIDCVPLGDIAATVVTLLQGDPGVSFRFSFALCGMAEPFTLDTEQMRAALGGEVPLNAPEVLVWAGECVREALQGAFDAGQEQAGEP